mmetsp:Transcript_22595/g.35251  ORF Transcript_22595/g.35251 Transcript_22595/m.35251 type:complete len:423 (-) Transcript_22595:141-1409(-)
MENDMRPPLLAAPCAQEMSAGGINSFDSCVEAPWAEALVFEGGGTKGIHYAGAIRELADNKALLGVRHFAGTSAGAQTAALLAFGYTGEEMESLMLETPWSTLLDGAKPPCGWGCCCGYGCCKGCCRLYYHHGFYVGDVLENFIDAKFAAKRANRQLGCTFRELHNEFGVELRVGVCNMTAKQFEYFDRHSHPFLKVCEAVRASSAIPLVFLPRNINGSVYVDGMFQGNLPIAAFPDMRTLAFHLSTSEGTDSPPKSVWSFLGDILDMTMNSAQRRHGINFMSFRPPDASNLDAPEPESPKIDILTIDCGQSGSLETGVSQSRIREMMDNGRMAAKEYLEERGIRKPPPLPAGSLQSITGKWTGGSIADSELIWSNGTISTINILAANEFTVYTNEGVRIVALKDDGKLHWDNGDVWGKAVH